MKFERYEIWGHNVNEDTLEEMSEKAVIMYVEPIDQNTDIREVYEKMLDLAFRYSEEFQYFELIYQKIDGLRIINGSLSFY